MSAKGRSTEYGRDLTNLITFNQRLTTGVRLLVLGSYDSRSQCQWSHPKGHEYIDLGPILLIISITIQMWRNFHPAVFQIIMTWSLQKFVHRTTVVLSWYVQNFVTIWLPGIELQLNEFSIEVGLWSKNSEVGPYSCTKSQEHTFFSQFYWHGVSSVRFQIKANMFFIHSN